jgi:hypothetical protein
VQNFRRIQIEQWGPADRVAALEQEDCSNSSVVSGFVVDISVKLTEGSENEDEDSDKSSRYDRSWLSTPAIHEPGSEKADNEAPGVENDVLLEVSHGH